jgi:hypothetical protein
VIAVLSSVKVARLSHGAAAAAALRSMTAMLPIMSILLSSAVDDRPRVATLYSIPVDVASGGPVSREGGTVDSAARDAYT